MVGMKRSEIDGILEAAELAVAQGEPLGPTGFWKAVAAVKADPDLVEAYADHIARIDEAAFRQWALVTVPMWSGNILMIGGTVVGFLLIWWAYNVEDFFSGLVFLAGLGVLLVTSHGLGHLVVGSLQGMRFIGWFIGSVKRPQPGVKLDYATYLRTPARSRAWMHASGALVTKSIPFLLLGAAWGADIPGWAVIVLLVVGVGQIITDILWSTRSSDWKKFKREMAFAQPS